MVLICNDHFIKPFINKQYIRILDRKYIQEQQSDAARSNNRMVRKSHGHSTAEYRHATLVAYINNSSSWSTVRPPPDEHERAASVF